MIRSAILRNHLFSYKLRNQLSIYIYCEISCSVIYWVITCSVIYWEISCLATNWEISCPAIYIVKSAVQLYILWNQLFSYILSNHLLSYILRNQLLAVDKGGIMSGTSKPLLVHIDMKGGPPTPVYLNHLLQILKTWGTTGILIEWEDMFPWEGDLKVSLQYLIIITMN